jgi:inorganic pyrophosphatase
MQIDKIPAGAKLPDEFNVIIEIPMDSMGVKYEMDKDSGAIFVDRFMKVAMYYPCNYGFIPHTLGGDGDPIDILLIAPYPIIAGAVVAARAVGVLIMEDESGQDEKIIAVPTVKIHPEFAHIQDINDVSASLKDKLKHFFERYKDLDQNKWVKVKGWEDKEAAKSIIQEAFVRNAQEG